MTSSAATWPDGSPKTPESIAAEVTGHTYGCNCLACERARRGLYCKHGYRLMVPDLPGEYESYPPLVFVEVDEWPCNQPECSREQVEAHFEREAAEYEEERWAQYMAMISW